MLPIKCIAWDFDGVLNANVIDGRLIWADDITTDLGIGLEHFQTGVFGPDFKRVIRGEIDLLDHLRSWLSTTNYAVSAEDLLAYWLKKDALPDPDMLALMDQASAVGLRQVIATNNEAQRARYIMGEMGFSTRAEAIFASGNIGSAKPDADFFATVTTTLNLDPRDMLLVDDALKNVQAAYALGWNTFAISGSGQATKVRHHIGL